MKTFALLVAFASVMLVAPRTLSAEGNCPGPKWEVWLVDPSFPSDRNHNGIVCVKFHEGNPNDPSDNSFRTRDDF
jgi:hypothetical protein